MEYRDVAWAEMKPDIYGGDTCDQHIPRWDAHSDGDKDGDCDINPLILNASSFPPGTRVVISMPVCPKCDETQESCRCGFDWKLWVEDQYA